MKHDTQKSCMYRMCLLLRRRHHNSSTYVRTDLLQFPCCPLRKPIKIEAIGQLKPRT